MTLNQLRPIANRILKPFVDLLEGTGVGPDAVSAASFAMAVGAAVAFAFAGGLVGDARPTLYVLGGALVFSNGVLDLLDGALARRIDHDSAAGDLLDHVLDRYADLLIVGGLTAAVDQWLLGFVAVTGVLMTSYLGTQVQAVGLDRNYGGAMGRADRLALVTVVALAAPFVGVEPLGLSVVGWLLAVFAVVGHLTALQRFYGARRDLGA